MMITSRQVKKIVAIFLIAGAVISFALMLWLPGIGKVFLHFIPMLITLAVVIFMIAAGIYYLKNEGSESGDRLLIAALIIHAFHFCLLGFVFEGHYGVYLAVDFYFKPVVDFSFDFDLLSFQFTNGYSNYDERLSFGVNVVPLFVLLFISRLEKKEKERKEAELLLEGEKPESENKA